MGLLLLPGFTRLLNTRSGGEGPCVLYAAKYIDTVNWTFEHVVQSMNITVSSLPSSLRQCHRPSFLPLPSSCRGRTPLKLRHSASRPSLPPATAARHIKAHPCSAPPAPLAPRTPATFLPSLLSFAVPLNLAAPPFLSFLCSYFPDSPQISRHPLPSFLLHPSPLLRYSLSLPSCHPPPASLSPVPPLPAPQIRA